MGSASAMNEDRLTPKGIKIVNKAYLPAYLNSKQEVEQIKQAQERKLFNAKTKFPQLLMPTGVELLI